MKEDQISDQCDPEMLMKAHQYLYYCMARPVISDHEYDQFCLEHKLDGKGGSDCEWHYSEEEKELAIELLQ